MLLLLAASCGEKEKYTAQTGEDGYELGHCVEMDMQSRYSAPKEAHWLLRRIYILSWIRNYDRPQAFADLIAGITLGLTIIPQSIAYASLAGLSSEYGLYSAFIGSIIYVFFGTIPQVSIGPTSLMAIMTLQFCADKPVQVVIVLAFLAGLVELLMGICQLGFIVSFIPSPVTKAFTSGTAVIVVLVQIKNLLGIRLKQVPSLGEFFGNIRWSDAGMGISCMCLLLSLRVSIEFEFSKGISFYVSSSAAAAALPGEVQAGHTADTALEEGSLVHQHLPQCSGRVL